MTGYYTFLQSRLTIRQNCFTHSAYRGHHFLPFHHKCSPFAKTINRHSITTRHWAKLSTVSKTDRHWVKWIAYRRNGSSIVNNILIFQQNPACIFRQSEKHTGNDQNSKHIASLSTVHNTSLSYVAVNRWRSSWLTGLRTWCCLFRNMTNLHNLVIFAYLVYFGLANMDLFAFVCSFACFSLYTINLT